MHEDDLALNNLEWCTRCNGSVRGTIVIVVGNGPDDTGSNPRRD